MSPWSRLIGGAMLIALSSSVPSNANHTNADIRGCWMLKVLTPRQTSIVVAKLQWISTYFCPANAQHTPFEDLNYTSPFYPIAYYAGSNDHTHAANTHAKNVSHPGNQSTTRTRTIYTRVQLSAKICNLWAKHRHVSVLCQTSWGMFRWLVNFCRLGHLLILVAPWRFKGRPVAVRSCVQVFGNICKWVTDFTKRTQRTVRFIYRKYTARKSLTQIGWGDFRNVRNQRWDTMTTFSRVWLSSTVLFIQLKSRVFWNLELHDLNRWLPMYLLKITSFMLQKLVEFRLVKSMWVRQVS